MTLARRIAESELWLCDNDVDMHCRYCSAQHPIHEADCISLAALAEVAAESAVVWDADRDGRWARVGMVFVVIWTDALGAPQSFEAADARARERRVRGKMADIDLPTAKAIVIGIARKLSEER